MKIEFIVVEAGAERRHAQVDWPAAPRVGELVGLQDALDGGEIGYRVLTVAWRDVIAIKPGELAVGAGVPFIEIHLQRIAEV